MTLTFLLLLVAAAAILPGCASFYAERKAPPLGRFVEADGVRLHVVEAGPQDAPAVVLIHGASVNLRDMKISLGDALAERYRVVLIDRPGRGYSQRPRDGWRLDRQAALVKGALDALGVERPIVVGQSFGGAVALAYALQYQDETAGLVLLAPVSHEWPGGVAWYNKASGWPVAGVLFRRFVLPLYAPLAVNGGVAESFAPDEPPPNYADEAGLALLFRPGDFRANAEDLRRLKPQIVAMQSRYGALRLPVTIVTGAADATVSPRRHSKALAAEVPHARLAVLPDTGHALHHAETARIVALIDEMAADLR
ncbi:alpha/beta fold hydrolase [Amphiplicatus metriothermophilus]|nr:alpha/beta hydrolase [Amphiplicatus metriothermophilus]MBB5520057.1 pimeloyl-ACP methyl ester carboxylesterase [Amphiplicatus metriothermophilus]